MKKRGCISIFLVLFILLVGISMYFINSFNNDVQSNMTIVEEVDSIESSQKYYRVILKDTHKKYIEGAFEYLIDQNQSKGYDSIFVHFNVNQNEEAGHLLATARKTWTSRGEKQLGLDTHEIDYEFTKYALDD